MNNINRDPKTSGAAEGEKINTEPSRREAGRGDGMILPHDTYVIVKPKPLVTICGWCPGAREKVIALAALGNNVTHGMCVTCQEEFK